MWKLNTMQCLTLQCLNNIVWDIAVVYIKEFKIQAQSCFSSVLLLLYCLNRILNMPGNYCRNAKHNIVHREWISVFCCLLFMKHVRMPHFPYFI